MKLLITAMSAATGPSGICRHACNLVRCAASREEVLQITLVIGKWQKFYFLNLLGPDNAKLTIISVDIPNEAYSRNLWHLRDLPGTANKVAADLIHLSFPVPILRRTIRCPVIVSLHDLYPYDEPDNFGFPRVFFNRVFLQQCLREVDCIACVSETTFTRLKERVPYVSYRKGVVIYNCVLTSVDEIQLPAIGERQFLLMIAQHRANKNIPLVLEVLEKLLQSKSIDEKTLLLLVGNQGSETSAIKFTVLQKQLSKNFRLINGISDAQLRWLYTHCKLLIAPSFTEGFSFPVVEGLFYGSRVVCSDIPAFREIGGDSCYYFDLHAKSASSSMTAAISRALMSPAKPVDLLERFLPINVAGEYVALYTRLLRNN
jgi:glycosyltransferase involved in cell wall biosynthesis